MSALRQAIDPDASAEQPAPAQAMTSLTDEALMRRWCDGDELAFNALVLRYRQPLFGFLVAITCDPQQAEDALSETFFRLAHKRHTYRPGNAFGSWLFSIGRNCATDTQRARGRFGALLRRVIESRPRRSEREDPESRHMQSEQQRRVTAAMSRLIPEHREVLALAYYEQLKGPEIAALLDLSPRQVRDRLSYARRKLREQLEEGEP